MLSRYDWVHPKDVRDHIVLNASRPKRGKVAPVVFRLKIAQIAGVQLLDVSAKRDD